MSTPGDSRPATPTTVELGLDLRVGGRPLVLRGALACHEGMATFAEAQVAGATGER